MESAANRAERLLQIESLLLTHPEGLTRAEIARRMGVHRSTIGRDIDTMSGRVPIWEDDANRLGIDQEHYLMNVRVTLHEAMALHLAARLLATRSDKHNPHAAAALRKLGLALERMAPLVSHHLKLSAEVMDSPDQRRSPEYMSALENLTKAWALGRKVQLTHQARDGRLYDYHFAPFFIEPYAVGHTTHVIGRCDGSAGMRTFKLERIKQVTLGEQGYEIPADFDPREQLKDAWGIWYREGQPVEVLLRFHPRVARRVRETQWHRSQELEEQADGSLLWRARVAETQEMLPWIRGWGADVEVLGPKNLRVRLEKEAMELARLYQIGETKKSELVVTSTSLRE